MCRHKFNIGGEVTCCQKLHLASEAEDRQLLIHFLWSRRSVGEDKEKGRIDAFQDLSLW